jgi:hypothetical protein
LVAVVHLVAIVSNAVNLPYMDEWETLAPGALGPVLDWAWILRPHNEHRIVFTKILTWSLYKTTGWHHIANLVLNFFIYLAELGAFVWMLRAIAPQASRKERPFLSATEFFWCLLGLSGLAWENHSWGFQSQFHFFLLFYFVAMATAVRRDHWLWVSGIAAVASAWSFSSGVICAATVATLIAGRAMAGLVAWRKASIQIVIIGSGLALWRSGFEKNAAHPEFNWPWSKAFWTHNLTMLGSGWAMPANLKMVAAAGVLALLVLHFGMSTWQLVTNNRKKQATALLELGVAGAGLVAVAAVTSIARGGLGVEQANSARYTEFTFFILPLTWAALTRDNKIGLTQLLSKAQITAITVISFISLGFCFAPKFAFTEVYRVHRERMEAGRQCVAQYYAGTPPAGKICDTLYIAPIDRRLDRARELNLAFTAEYGINQGVTP